MDRLHKGGNPDVKVDTISFNAVLDAWARSGDRVAPRRAEQILNHMDELFRAGNKGVKPDRYTYNTLINVWAKSGERGSAARAENVLLVMEKRFREGDQDFKPNTRTYTSVIDAWAKSGEKGAARRAEQILNNMISRYEAAGDPDVKPNVHTANAVCNVSIITFVAQPSPSHHSHTNNCILDCYRHARFRRMMKTEKKHCASLSESLIGSRISRKWIQTVIRSLFFCLSAPICFHGKIARHGLITLKLFSSLAATLDT